VHRINRGELGIAIFHLEVLLDLARPEEIRWREYATFWREVIFLKSGEPSGLSGGEARAGMTARAATGEGLAGFDIDVLPL
jgi:hypothetical protein